MDQLIAPRVAGFPTPTLDIVKIVLWRSNGGSKLMFVCPVSFFPGYFFFFFFFFRPGFFIFVNFIIFLNKYNEKKKSYAGFKAVKKQCARVTGNRLVSFFGLTDVMPLFFFFFFFFKSCFMQSIHLFAGLPFGLLPSSLASRKCLLLRYLSCDQWRSKDVRGPWTTDSLGPLPILQNFIPLTPLPYTPQLRLCTRLSLYNFKYDPSVHISWCILEIWVPYDAIGEMGPLDDAMINGTPW